MCRLSGVVFLSLACLSVAADTRRRATPTPPCPAPPGVVPAVAESLCYTGVEPASPSGVAIRQYGFPANATFASGTTSGTYAQGVPNSIASVITYFSGGNDEQRNILAARTVPFAVRPPRGGAAYGVWTASMEVSPSQFPDDFLIPRPNTPVLLSRVADDIGLLAVFQFNTSGFPYLENFEEACGVIQNSTLPDGYAVNATHPWSPTFVLYNGQAAANFTNECWCVHALARAGAASAARCPSAGWRHRYP